MTEALIIVSQTAYQNGYGCRYRTAGGLTKDEKKAAREGVPVLFKGFYWSRKNEHGTLYREVYFRGGIYHTKVPTEETLKMIGERMR